MKRYLLIALLALPACRDEIADRPEPVTMTAAAVGHYCQMDLLEHPGPKAQVHLRDIAAPLFFSQVRDAIAFQRMPEQSDPIAAIYVSDMARAPEWDAPGADNWIAAEEAWFVVGSRQTGGMGAEELVPFSTKIAAEDFATQHGGRLLRLSEVPDSEILAPANTSTLSDQKSDGSADYLDRLKALSAEDNS